MLYYNVRYYEVTQGNFLKWTLFWCSRQHFYKKKKQGQDIFSNIRSNLAIHFLELTAWFSLLYVPRYNESKSIRFSFPFTWNITTPLEINCLAICLLHVLFTIKLHKFLSFFRHWATQFLQKPLGYSYASLNLVSAKQQNLNEACI